MIIVTGGAGFIGSNIVKELNRQGRTDILIVDDLNNRKKENQSYRNLRGLQFMDYMHKDAFLEAVLNDDFEEIYKKLADADGIVFVTAVYWHDMTECMKVFMDRLRRCETAHNHFLKDKRCFLIACAGGTGNGAVRCLYLMEESLKHMGMRAYDRIPVIRFNKEYILPALETAGKLYGQRIPDKFE